MYMDVCIKNIADDDWITFKTESAKHGVRMGDFFSRLVEEHEEKCTESNWDKVLFGEKICKGMVTSEEGKKVRELFRKGFSMRG